MHRDFKFTDLGNAEQLVHRHQKQIRYCSSGKKWLMWDGKRWVLDATNFVMRCAKETIRSLYGEAAHMVDDTLREALRRHAHDSEDVRPLRAMIQLAESEEEVAVAPEAFDADPWLLNCANGVVDLRTGLLQGHCPDQLITKIIPVLFDPKATCPTFEKFLKRIMNEDAGLIGYLQRLFGYALSGDIREQALFIFHGPGANGKTTCLETMATLLNDYGAHALAETILVKKGNASSNDVARLAGKRFVIAAESEEGRKLASAQVKAMTGGDVLTARFLYGEFFEFRPQFKIFLATNHVPLISDTSHAIWRRIHLVPFAVQIPPDERDKRLPEKLRAELSGILNWAVQGCLDWQEHGLDVPQAVEQATTAYQKEMDTLEGFFCDFCTLQCNLRIGAGVLHHVYVEWAKDHGERVLTTQEFKQRMMERGFVSKRSGPTGNYEWHGIALVQPRTEGLMDTEPFFKNVDI